jgi:hypothetical protein
LHEIGLRQIKGNVDDAILRCPLERGQQTLDAERTMSSSEQKLSKQPQPSALRLRQLAYPQCEDGHVRFHFA